MTKKEKTTSDVVAGAFCTEWVQNKLRAHRQDPSPALVECVRRQLVSRGIVALREYCDGVDVVRLALHEVDHAE
jgi:hypothetical protein